MQGGSTGASRTSRSNEKITKSKNRRTKEIDDKIVALRSALFSPNGRDKNVTEGIAPAFLSFTRNDLNLQISFSSKLSNDQLDFVFEMVKDNMEDRYDASGYGWDDEDKERELTEEGTRFLLIRDMSKDSDDENDRIVGFVHFRFSVQGDIMDVMAGDTCLFLWDIHLEEEYQRKGVGKHVVTLLELIARREKMSQILIPIQLQDEITSSWVTKSLKGFVSQSVAMMQLLSFDADAEGFQVFGKDLIAPVKKTVPVAPTAAPVVFNFNNQAEEKAKQEAAKIQANANMDAAVDSLNVSVNELNISSSSADSSPSNPDSNGTDSLENSADDDAELDLASLNEYDVIHGLKVLYFEKNGVQPKDEEVAQWMTALKAQKEEQA